MSNFVNKIKKGETEYDIQDARIPAAETTDAGKVLKVTDTGGYELGEAGGDSHKVYDLSTNSDATLNDLITEIGWDKTGTYYEDCEIKATGLGRPLTTGFGSLQMQIQGSRVFFYFASRELTGTVLKIWNAPYDLDKNLGLLIYDATERWSLVLPYKGDNATVALYTANGNGYWFDAPSDLQGKTYALKIVDGSLQWVEETA